jgi:CRISPR-associated protein Cst1
MKTVLESEYFDTMLEPTDWRYSAAAVGLVRYFNHYKNLGENIEYSKEFDCIKFKQSDITEERYLKFAESYYKDEFHHIFAEKMLHSNDKFSDELIKLVNEKLTANTIMKSIFGKIKFDGNNKIQILSLIDENRSLIIKETFRNKSNMYKNYSNPNLLLEQRHEECCRLNGYYVDAGKKGKSIAYNFNTSTHITNDEDVFDFIPFAFTDGREVFFINDNLSIGNLIYSNDMLKLKVSDATETKSGQKDVRKIFFAGIIESTDFIDFDVEVIVKNRDSSYFETMYIRKRAIEILKKIRDYNVFCFSYKVSESYYINIGNGVISCILNNLLLDEYIEMFLKLEGNKYLTNQFININMLIKNKEGEGGGTMNKSMYIALKSAERVAGSIEANKLKSYRQKLTSAIVFKDYDRVCQILLQLSNFSGVNFDFAYDLYEDFEDNKEVAYTFINALKKEDKMGGNKTNE